MRYTPGPWHTSLGSVRTDYITRDGSHKLIANVYSGNEFDALLIAAAPELMAACELALEWLDEVCNPEAVDWLVDQDGVAARRQIEAAIIKTKGEYVEADDAE